uniref:Myotubularin-related protein 9 (Trinotate prediction) n=1 Tax=Myxobolus squamalis TaxID=59785 RepID=A0A6B2GB58_MYXSQ
MMNMTCFEFTDKFLKNIYHHSFSSDYGDFLFNSPKDREDKKGYELTLSLFSRLRMAENIKEYLNPIFNMNSPMKTEISSQNYKSWDHMFMRSTGGDFLDPWEMLRNLKIA